jgi:acetyl esterase/lipase
MDSAIRDYFRQILIQQIAPTFRGGGSLAQQRELLDTMGKAAELPEGLEVSTHEIAGRPCEWLRYPNHDNTNVLLYLHGGGYVLGSCHSHRALVSRLALACGVQALVLDYRLAPEHPFPAGLDDAVAVYQALLADGLDPRRIIIGGDSAGGGLSLATLLRLRDLGAPLPAAAILLSPFTDLTCSGETLTTRAAIEPWLAPELFEPLARLYAGRHDRRGPLLSPLFADLRGLPPLIVHVGDQEVLLADSTRLAERARAADVAVELEVWPELWHVFQFFAPHLPEAQRSLDRIGALVRARLAHAAT